MPCSTTTAVSRTLSPDRLAPQRAREFLQSAACSTHRAKVLDEAALLTSELVTNAVRHGGPPIVVEVACNESTGMTVRVRDGSSSHPVVQQADGSDESGRGVQLVDILSEEWGVDPLPGDGKVVWFAMRPT